MIREKYPDVMICVDAVSSMAGVPMKFDEWGVDVLLASVQKAFAIRHHAQVSMCKYFRDPQHHLRFLLANLLAQVHQGP